MGSSLFLMIKKEDKEGWRSADIWEADRTGHYSEESTPESRISV